MDSNKLENIYCLFEVVNSYLKGHEAIEYVCSKFISQGYEVEHTEHINFGHPDLIICKNGEKIYVEVKSPSDSLRDTQINWALKNPDKKMLIYWLSICRAPMTKEEYYPSFKDKQNQRYCSQFTQEISKDV